VRTELELLWGDFYMKKIFKYLSSLALVLFASANLYAQRSNKNQVCLLPPIITIGGENIQTFQTKLELLGEFTKILDQKNYQTYEAGFNSPQFCNQKIFYKPDGSFYLSSDTTDPNFLVKIDVIVNVEFDWLNSLPVQTFKSIARFYKYDSDVTKTLSKAPVYSSPTGHSIVTAQVNCLEGKICYFEADLDTTFSQIKKTLEFIPNFKK